MVDVTLDEITSSGSATATYLKETVLPGISDPSKRGVFLSEIVLRFARSGNADLCDRYPVGQKSMELELEAAGISYTGGTDPANDVVLPPRDFSHIVPDPSIGVVCYSFDININYTKVRGVLAQRRTSVLTPCRTAGERLSRSRLRSFTKLTSFLSHSF